MFEYKGNRLAKICVDSLANKSAPFTVLFLYGQHGCGKTTMLRYLEYEAYKNRKVTTSYIHARAFADDQINIYDFFNDFKKEDVLMIDDFQLLKDNNFALIEMKNYINDIHVQNKKLVLTSDRALKDFDRDDYPKYLFERLDWEMLLRIDNPERKDCLNALKEMAEKASLRANPDIEEVYNMILDAEGNHLGSVLDTFGRIVARATMTKKNITAEFAKSVIYGDSGIEIIGI